MTHVPETRPLRDLAISFTAAYMGTGVMEQFNALAYEKLESKEDREREEAVRPGPPPWVAAKKISGWLGLKLSEDQLNKAGLALHYLLPTQWVPVYMALRRRTAMRPLRAGLAMGAAMSLIADEGMTPLLGFSAPNRAYPHSTHIRAFVSHLVFGVSAGVVVEGAWKLVEDR